MPPFESGPSTEDPRSHLELALACLERGDLVGAQAAARAAALLLDVLSFPNVLIVRDDASIFELNGRLTSLARRAALRRVLAALCDAHQERRVLTRDDVLAAGWPGERIEHESGALRVYTTIRRLRVAGLEDALLTHDDGYRLDPHLRVLRL